MITNSKNYCIESLSGSLKRTASWRRSLQTRYPDSLNPPYKSGGQADRGQIISRQSIVARCNAPEVLQSAEGILDARAKLVEVLVEAERLLPVAAIGNDGLGSTFTQLPPTSLASIHQPAEQPRVDRDVR
jgi:hypothetical protein